MSYRIYYSRKMYWNTVYKLINKLNYYYYILLYILLLLYIIIIII